MPGFGTGLPPNDSLRTLTWSWLTAQSRPWRISLLKAKFVSPNTFMTARLAPGATPSIWIVQPAGSGWAGFTSPLRSNVWLPWEMIELASPNASSPPVTPLVPSPVKSW